MTDIKKYLSEIGQKGGSAGRGASKRRDPEHYRKMVENRKKKREQNLIHDCLSAHTAWAFLFLGAPIISKAGEIAYNVLPHVC